MTLPRSTPEEKKHMTEEEIRDTHQLEQLVKYLQKQRIIEQEEKRVARERELKAKIQEEKGGPLSSIP